MKTLIITEDATTLSTLTGALGKTYYWLVTRLQKLKLKIFLNFIDQENSLLLVNQEQAPAVAGKVIFWDQALSQNQLYRERALAWKITNQTIAPHFKNLKYKDISFIKIWQTYLTAYLSHNILSYRQTISRTIKQFRPSHIVIFGSSIQEELAKFLAQQNQVKVISYNFPDFSRLGRWLSDWLYNRELTHRLKKFISSQSVNPIKPPSGSYLLVVSFFRHLKTLVPLSQALNKKNMANVFVADDLNISPANCLYLTNYLNYSSINQILKQSKGIAKLAHDQFISKIAVSPHIITDLVLQLLHGYLGALFIKAFPLICLYLEAGNNLIKQVKPKGIFLISDVRPLEVSLGLLAEKHKIPSLLVSPNTILSLDAINQYSLADQVTVIGPHIKSQLLKIGVPAKKIHVVGDLRFDSVTSKKTDEYKNKVYQKLNINSQTNLFLLISFRANPRIPLSEKRRFIKMAYQAVEHIPNSQLVIKPHPTETRSKLLNQLQDWGFTNILVTDNQQFELIDLLSACRAVLLTWSMSGFESLILKKPVVIINPTLKDYDEIIPYVKNNGAQLAKSSQKLRKLLTQLISDQSVYQQWIKNGRQFVDHYILPPDGRAGERIIQIIKAISAGRK